MLGIAVWLLASSHMVVGDGPLLVPRIITGRSASTRRVVAPDAVREGAFTRLVPSELQFSCMVGGDGNESDCLKILLDAEREPAERLAAARALWRGRSRPNASEVLKFLAGPPAGGDAYRAFQREVEASLQPAAVLRELKEGDHLWGALAGVPTSAQGSGACSVDGAQDKPKEQHATMLALGNSGDPRALEPLLARLADKDHAVRGYAAQALGYLGGPGVEAKLIEALSADYSWLHV